MISVLLPELGLHLRICIFPILHVFNIFASGSEPVLDLACYNTFKDLKKI
jgi:hypothetical protein